MKLFSELKFQREEGIFTMVDTVDVVYVIDGVEYTSLEVKIEVE